MRVRPYQNNAIVVGLDLGGGGSINEKILTMDLLSVRAWKWTLLSLLRGGEGDPNGYTLRHCLDGGVR